MASCPWLLEQGLPLLGALTVLWLGLKAAWKLGWGARTYLLSEVWKGAELARYGAWAVVTGATAGIGRAYAHELARRGLHVVLISRSLQKLKQVAAEIEEQHGRSTKIIAADFTGGPEIYEPIRAALQGLEIGVLVNNVGMAQTTGLSRFLNIPDPDKAVPDMVNCNMLSVTMMTQIVLPQMVARRKGIIINLSSELGRHPAPLAVLYGATKTFVDFFSRGLEAEYRSRGIIVQSVLPLLVSTNMTFNVAPSRFVKSAEDYAREALNTVGLTSRTSGCLSHAIQAFFCDLLLPEWFRLSSFGFKLQTNLWRRMKDTVAVSKRK